MSDIVLSRRSFLKAAAAGAATVALAPEIEVVAAIDEREKRRFWNFASFWKRGREQAPVDFDPVLAIDTTRPDGYLYGVAIDDENVLLRGEFGVPESVSNDIVYRTYSGLSFGEIPFGMRDLNFAPMNLNGYHDTKHVPLIATPEEDDHLFRRSVDPYRVQRIAPRAPDERRFVPGDHVYLGRDGKVHRYGNKR